MKDVEGNVVQGRTRWWRFAAAAVPATVAAGAIVFGMANGAIAASFSVSGQTFKVSADKLDATGFVQYGGLASEKGAGSSPTDPKNHAVATAGMASATLTNLCQSVKMPGLPVSLVINAGGNGTPATAKNLIIDMTDLTGDATFTNINIGQDASTLDAAGPDLHGTAGSFGQQAQHVLINNVRQTAWSTSAGEFTLNGLHMYISVSASGTPTECF